MAKICSNSILTREKPTFIRKVIFFADFSKDFILTTDASSVAVAGVLIQIIDNQQKSISCVSKTLTETEQNWSATEREAYGILFACKKLGYFLKGR